VRLRPDHQQEAGSDDKHEFKATKPCLCQLPPLGRIFWTATSEVNERNQPEFRCRICGAPRTPARAREPGLRGEQSK